MAKIRKTLLCVLLLLILICNFSEIFRVFFLAPILGKSNISSFKEYVTLHGEFYAHEEGFKGSSFYDIQRRYFIYLNCHPSSTDKQLYRTFKMNPWEFWNWIVYFTHPRYKLPYILKNDILFSNERPPTTCPERYPEDKIEVK